MENLKSQILEDLKTAMKEKNTSKLEAVRAAKAAIDKFEKENPGDTNCAKALKSLIKQRTESAEIYKTAGSLELAKKEEDEITVIDAYLQMVQPKQMNKEEMESVAKKFVTENSLGKNDMGKIMSHFKSNYEGQYDGKELSIIAKNVLV
jgi:uncharacterized protein YqeY